MFIVKFVFTPIGDLLKILPRRSKTPEAILALSIRRAGQAAILKLCTDLSEEVMDSVKVVSFKNKTLTVKAPMLAAAALQMRAGGLLSEINKTVGGRAVGRLRFRVD